MSKLFLSLFGGLKIPLFLFTPHLLRAIMHLWMSLVAEGCGQKSGQLRTGLGALGGGPSRGQQGLAGGTVGVERVADDIGELGDGQLGHGPAHLDSLATALLLGELLAALEESSESTGK